MKNIGEFKVILKEIYCKENRGSFIKIVVLLVLKSLLLIIPPVFTMKILDEAIPKHLVLHVFLFAFLILLFTALSSFVEIKLTHIYNLLSQKVYIRFQEKCISHLFQLGGNFYSEMSTGDTFVTILQDTNQLRTLVSSIIFEFVSEIVVAVTVFFVLIFIQWDLLVIIAAIIPIVYLSQKYFQRKEKEKLEEAREVNGILMGVIENIIGNTLNCIYSNGRKFFLAKYNKAVHNTTDKEVDVQMCFAVNMGILGFISSIVTIIILGYGGIKVIAGAFSIGGLLAFNMYAQNLISPIMNVSRVLMEMQSTVVSMKRIKDFLNKKGMHQIEKPKSFNRGMKLSAISFQDVSFQFEEGIEVLNNICFELASNEVNAIVGKSGCGKSTIVSLLYRIWDVHKGKIKLAGINIKDYKIEELRENITVISQNSFLFDDTVCNNILMGNEIDREKMYFYTKIACIHDYIMTLPDQYDSMIGENGIKLSGGEKQRICIARALLRENNIIIFDEATSALDQYTEQQIFHNIKQFLINKTIIVITHRLHTIKFAKHIIVMEEGKINGCGSHEELLETCNIYQNILNGEAE